MGFVVGRRCDLLGLCIYCCDGDLCNVDCFIVFNVIVNNVNKLVISMLDYVVFYVVVYSFINNVVVIFDYVIINVGGGYDNIIGVFIVFIFGLYVFFWIIEMYG